VCNFLPVGYILSVAHLSPSFLVQSTLLFCIVLAYASKACASSDIIQIGFLGSTSDIGLNPAVKRGSGYTSYGVAVMFEPRDNTWIATRDIRSMV